MFELSALSDAVVAPCVPSSCWLAHSSTFLTLMSFTMTWPAFHRPGTPVRNVRIFLMASVHELNALPPSIHAHEKLPTTRRFFRTSSSVSVHHVDVAGLITPVLQLDALSLSRFAA